MTSTQKSPISDPALARSAGGEHVIEVTWNAGDAEASPVKYEFASKEAADAFVKGAEQALGGRTFEVRVIAQDDPPRALRELVDRLHAFWDQLPERPQSERSELCVTFLRSLGHADAFEWHSGGGFWHALCGVEEQGRVYVVWTGIDACGCNAAADLSQDALAEAFGDYDRGFLYVREDSITEPCGAAPTDSPGVG